VRRVALADAQEPRPEREEGAVRRVVATVEEVPRERADYDARVTRHFLTGEELTARELDDLLDRAIELKRDRLASRALAGRSVALIFEQPSTRTRLSFEVGVHELGGHPVVLRQGEMQIARGESTRDTATVLSRFVHAIAIRTVPHATVVELAEHSGVPVINMLTAEHHPCQALADLMTLRERFGDLHGRRLTYVGDGNNVAHSLMLLGAKAGMEVVVATPGELQPDARYAVSLNGGSASITNDAQAAAEGADALYTDVWVSMGDDEAQAAARRELLAPYRLDEALLARASSAAVALHCLPAHPGEEITEGVLYGERSAVWDQAENRLHAQKALLELLMA
jgi:ornithine carbamoyltransferase